MDKTVIIFGSTTGMTQDVASRIATQLNVSNEHLIEVSQLTKELIEQYDVLLLGSSTWGSGELQDDWYDGVKILKSANLQGKRIALFGTGDCESYPDTFCDALGLIYQEIASSGAIFMGQTDPSEYSYEASVALVDEKFIGLPLDETNEYNLTDDRISRWIASLSH